MDPGGGGEVVWFLFSWRPVVNLPLRNLWAKTHNRTQPRRTLQGVCCRTRQTPGQHKHLSATSLGGWRGEERLGRGVAPAGEKQMRLLGPIILVSSNKHIGSNTRCYKINTGKKNKTKQKEETKSNKPKKQIKTHYEMVCDSVRNVAWMDCLYFRSRTSSSKDVVRAKARGGLSARSTTVSGSASKPDEQWSWRSNSESPESEANLQAGREGREDATWVSAALFFCFFF